MTTKLERQYQKLLVDENRAFVRYRQADRKQTRRGRKERHGIITLVFIDPPRSRLREYQEAAERRWRFEQEFEAVEVQP